MAVTWGAVLLATLALPISAGSAQEQNRPTPLELTHRMTRHFDDRPPVQFEVDLGAERGPRLMVTNLHQYALTAVVIQKEFAQGKGVSQTILLDALTRSALLAAVPRGLSFIMSLPVSDRETLPDTRLVAAVWEDGSTYGPEDLLQQVVAGRAATTGIYERALSLLEEGLEKNWTADQYISAANKLRNALATEGSAAQSSVVILMSITSSLQAAQARGQLQVTRVAKALAEHFRQSREALRLATDLPPASSPPGKPPEVRH